MKFKNFKYTALLALTIYIPTYSHDTLPNSSEASEQEILRSNTQQQMIANFFNIVIQGLLLVNAEKKEDQIQAAANAINSISNITQLTVRTPALDNDELLNYAALHHEEILAYIEGIMNSERRNEHEQID